MRRINQKGKSYSYFTTGFRNPNTLKRTIESMYIPKRVFVPKEINVKRKSQVDVIYRHREKYGYDFFIRSKKKGKYPFMHPVTIQER